MWNYYFSSLRPESYSAKITEGKASRLSLQKKWNISVRIGAVKIDESDPILIQCQMHVFQFPNSKLR